MAGFSLIGKLGLDTGDYDRGLAKGEVAYQKFGQKLEGFSKKQEKFLFKQLVGSFGVAAIEGTILRNLEKGQQIFNEAAKAGVNVEKYQEMAFAAQQTGRSIEDLLRLTGQLPSDVQEAVDRFRELGGVIPKSQIFSLNAGARAVQETREGADRLGEWGALGAAGIGRFSGLLTASLLGLFHVAKGKLTGNPNEQDYGQELAAPFSKHMNLGDDEEGEGQFLSAKLAARAQRAKAIRDSVKRIFEDGQAKLWESLPKSDEIAARQKQIDDLMRKAASKQGREHEDLIGQADIKRAELAVFKATPEKFGESSLSGRSLAALDPLNRIGGFAQGRDTVLSDRFDRITKATEETAANTRGAQNPMGESNGY